MVLSRIRHTLSRLFPSPPPQELIDLQRAAFLLLSREWYKTQGNLNAVAGGNRHLPKPPKEVVETFFVKVDELSSNSSSNKQLKSFVQKQLNQQIVEMFQHIDGVYGSMHGTGDDGMENVKRIGSEFGKTKLSDDAIKAKEEKALEESVGFTLEVKKSSIISKSSSFDAGNGLFVKSGVILPGSIIAIVPGLVHLREHLLDENHVRTLLPDPDLLLMSRMDGIIIDSRTTKQVPWNPYGLAHFVNHMPSMSADANGNSNMQPNSLQLSIDFPSDPLDIDKAFPHELRIYIPNAYAKPPTFLGTIDRSAFMHSIVLLSTQPLFAGAEVLMDYRLNNPASGSLPDWYISDENTAKRRWGKAGDDDAPGNDDKTK